MERIARVSARDTEYLSISIYKNQSLSIPPLHASYVSIPSMPLCTSIPSLSYLYTSLSISSTVFMLIYPFPLLPPIPLSII